MTRITAPTAVPIVQPRRSPPSGKCSAATPPHLPQVLVRAQLPHPHTMMTRPISRFCGLLCCWSCSTHWFILCSAPRMLDDQALSKEVDTLEFELLSHFIIVECRDTDQTSPSTIMNHLGSQGDYSIHSSFPPPPPQI